MLSRLRKLDQAMHTGQIWNRRIPIRSYLPGNPFQSNKLRYDVRRSRYSTWSFCYKHVKQRYDAMRFRYDAMRFRYDLLLFRYDYIALRYDSVEFRYDSAWIRYKRRKLRYDLFRFRYDNCPFSASFVGFERRSQRGNGLLTRSGADLSN